MSQTLRRPARCLGLLLTLLAPAGTVLAQMATFAPQTPVLSTGSNTAPTTPVVTDLNGDGHPDIVVADAYGGTLRVLLGDGTGHFVLQAPALSTGAASFPSSVVLADVNGDGKLDAITANLESNTLGVLLGHGTGQFTLQANPPATGDSPSRGAVADVTGDGKLDAITANMGSSTLRVLLGDGAGHFAPQPNPPATGTAPDDMAVADVNGDGHPDVLTANQVDETLSVLLGDGAGHFALQANPPTTGTGNKPYGVAIADVNGDGKPDALTANQDASSLSVLLGDGAGHFALQAPALSTGAASFPSSVVLTDVNGDGKLDALVPIYVGTVKSLGVLLGDGAGHFALQANPTATGGGAFNLFSLAVADVNGDARPDAIATDLRASTLEVLLNTTAYQPTTVWTAGGGPNWFTPTSWTNGVPTAAVDAIVPQQLTNGFYPVIDGGTATSRSLTINSGASVTQSGTAATTLDVRGDFINNGIFKAGIGTVVLGTTAQPNGPNLTGNSTTAFYNLRVGTNGVLLVTDEGTSVGHVLTLDGALVTQGNPFTLRSDASATAMVVNNGTGGFIDGSAMFERYISGDLFAGAAYRHVVAPTGQATFGDLTTADFTPQFNTAFNTDPNPNAVQPFPTVFGYDQSRLLRTSNQSVFDKGWVSPGGSDELMNAGQGYTVHLAGGQTLRFRGPQNNAADYAHPISQTLTRNTGTPDDEAGWALVGNPFPSPLDFSQVDAIDRIGLTGSIYVYGATGPYMGQYRTYLAPSGNLAGVGDPILPEGQGFFVRVATPGTSATLNFRNAQRVSSYQNPAYHRQAADIRPLVQLRLRPAGNAPLADDLYVYFDAAAGAGYNPQTDAEKLPNPNHLNLSSHLAATGQQLAIDGRPALAGSAQVVALAVGVPAAGRYTLAAALLNLSAVPTYLRDRQTGAFIDLARQPSYEFTVSDATTLLTGRFELVLSPQRALATAPVPLTQQLALYPNPASGMASLALPAELGSQPVAATLIDALGRVVRELLLPAQGSAAHALDLRGLPAGVYALRLTTSAGPLTRQLSVQ